MSSTLPGKLQALQWAVDHWDLTEGPIAEASDKQAKYIMNLLDQAQGKVPSQDLDDMMMAAGLPLVGAVGVSTMQDEILDLHWKKASTLINALKKALGPGAGLVGKATPNQLGFIWKLVQLKDAQSVEALFLGLGYDIPVSKVDLEKFNLSKADASKAIDALQAMPAATAVAQPSTANQREAIEDLIIAKGIMNPGLKPIAKKYGIKIFAGNVSVPSSMSYNDALAVIDQLAKVKDPPVSASSSEDPASGMARNTVFGLYTQKGGVANDKVVKILKSHGMTGPYSTAQDLPADLTDATAKTLIQQFKKLKMRKASRKQVAEILALLSQLGPAAWKKSPLSKKWPPKDLRSTSLMKRTSVEMKALIADLKKALVKAH